MVYLIIALATWRLANIISNESGPFNLFGRFRMWVGVQSVTTIQVINEQYVEEETWHGTNEIAKGLLCTYCNSVWIGLLFTLGYAILGENIMYFGLPFALSGCTVLLEELNG